MSPGTVDGIPVLQGSNRRALPTRLMRAPIGARSATKLGFFFVLLLLYLVFEYGRPSHPLGIPMVISALLLGGWLVSHNTGRKLSPQILCFFGFVVLMVVGVPMATNSYSAFWAAYGMATLLLCICAPMIRFVVGSPRPMVALLVHRRG